MLKAIGSIRRDMESNHNNGPKSDMGRIIGEEKQSDMLRRLGVNKARNCPLMLFLESEDMLVLVVKSGVAITLAQIVVPT